MSRKSATFIFLASLVFAIFLSSCASPFPREDTGGSLSISLTNAINARTLTPSISMDAASYTVTGTGPNGATFTATTTGAAVTKTALAFGSWTIVVNALNVDGALIGTGSATTTVATGVTTPVSVTVTPITGTGALSLTVSWPAAQVQTPSITATLTPALGTAQNLAFTVTGATATYSNAALGNGYYTLAFTINDNGIAEAGAVEVVRIVAGQTTSGSYSFANVNQAGGGIAVNITANMQNPLDVSIAGASATMSVGSTQSLTASVANYAGNVSYVWYVNGASQGTGASYTFGAGLSAGYYRVDVVAYTADGTRAGSATANVQVVASAVVSTLAGSTTVGSADGIGVEASFSFPSALVAVGTNLYIADHENNEIRKIVIATGAVTTFAGATARGIADGTGTNARFWEPGFIASDGNNLYVTDGGNNMVRKIEIATGTVTTLAGSATSGSTDGTGTSARFFVPTGITSDGTNLYVSDFMNNEIRKIVISTGAVTTFAGSTTGGFADGTSTTARFARPEGLTNDGIYLYVTDTLNNAIRKIEISSGIVSTIAGSGNPGFTDGIGSAASFNDPIGITSEGTTLYVADTSNHAIRKISTITGAVDTLAGRGPAVHGCINGPISEATFYYPEAIATDGISLFIADAGNCLIRVIR